MQPDLINVLGLVCVVVFVGVPAWYMWKAWQRRDDTQ
jgi:hypothetical protein